MADAQITKHALADAMKSLMAQHPFAKISVGDICVACGMSRKGFYYHFRDKYDLVNWIFYDQFLRPTQDKTYVSSWDLMQDVFDYMWENRTFYANALQVTGQNSFASYFAECMQPMVLRFVKDLFDSDRSLDFFITFFTDAFLASILRWLQDPHAPAPKEYLNLLQTAARGVARKTIHDLERAAPLDADDFTASALESP